MLFNSLHFLLFFPVVVLLYFSLPFRFRWLLLLLASYYFYMVWKVEYALILLFSTLIDYYCGYMMGKREAKRAKRPFLYLSLFTNLGTLFTFKYFNFFNDSLRELFSQVGISYALPAFALLLPMGISFYTFQTMSYSIDVYEGRIKPEKHLGIFALFVTFFPQLVAGPIERSENLLPQFHLEHSFNYNRLALGLQRMLWGFFKKVVIADRLALIVNEVYTQPTSFEGWPLLLATLFFAFQIYCDFSGYSDIAIGAAQVLGFRLMDNFNKPYFSASVSEFWKRWHISLSSWFKDYVYIPLGGNRTLTWRWYYNLFITFIISGLWHGANWTFVIWGALHGFYLVSAIMLAPYTDKIKQAIRLDKLPWIDHLQQVLTTFCLVCFAWIFFRANTLADAYYIISHLFTGLADHGSLQAIQSSLGSLPVTVNELLLSMALIVLLLCVENFSLHRPNGLRIMLLRQPFYIRWPVFYLLLAAILFLGVFEKTEFIYFQF